MTYFYKKGTIPFDAKCTSLRKGKIDYINLPVAFDIETSSFYEDDEKRACMYEWSFAIGELVVIGRTWEEFADCMQEVKQIYGVTEKRRMLIFVHNLSYEFQFIRKRFEWESVFALDELKPVKAVTVDGFEFRCSYQLTGYSLAKLAEQIVKNPIEKKTGDLDYKLIRHSETPLSDEELGYCINDVLILTRFIDERAERDGDLTKIPLTKTGYVRNYCRNECLFGGIKTHKKAGKFYTEYRELMNNLTIDADEYRQLKRAFQGGFTHANAINEGLIFRDVHSQDFTSSYPAVMCSEYFPMSRARIVRPTTREEFEKYLKCYCCLFDVRFTDLSERVNYDHPISASRCFDVRGEIEDNGRIVSASSVSLTCTEQDFIVYSKFYKWSKMEIANFRVYVKGYLPKPFIMSILKLYSDKTKLKDVEGYEAEYQNSKEMLNSCYGMCVTDICRDDTLYKEDEWSKSACDIEKAIEIYNKSPRRFLSYAWGVWTTAYARKNLFMGIYSLKHDYIYSDTDSVKYLRHEQHIDFFNGYNKMITEKLRRMCDHYDVDYSYINPITVTGKHKPLGVWSYEGMYSRFKTLGAKRYMVEHDGKINITVAGVNKKAAVPYMIEQYGGAVFEHFDEGLIIPPSRTGKNTHTYINEEHEGDVTDYMGATAHYHELSSVHLEECGYEMSMSALYINYLKGIKEGRI